MRQIHVYQAISTLYALLGVVMLLLVENSLGWGIMAIICFMGSSGYCNLANEKEQLLLNQWYEGTGND